MEPVLLSFFSLKLSSAEMPEELLESDPELELPLSYLGLGLKP